MEPLQLSFDYEYAWHGANISMRRIAECNVKMNLGLDNIIELLNQSNWEAPSSRLLAL